MAATLWVALGGAIGSVARHWLGLLLLPLSRGFPWGTVFVNISGSFLIALFGMLTVAQARFPASESLRLFVMVGFCGGFTTFSSFSLQTFELLQEGAPGHAFLNITLSVVLCLAASAAGYYAAIRLNGGTFT
ncbi:MAG: Putative fluoride ion transporter CrcB [Candidatus Tokpelaia hoelldobleri]|uniref:Fluoride-specific ion channel FluC n=1 Tax=Candidatus Tokpelaia hoelldobleri TaxID=1902579 RepID=A0A1U9JT50_9HYPH|nr:MAG: Putative fluoride ion transporter CrcB [Candidatus Tokpelaia hoelldoblerii]